MQKYTLHVKQGRDFSEEKQKKKTTRKGEGGVEKEEGGCWRVKKLANIATPRHNRVSGGHVENPSVKLEPWGLWRPSDSSRTRTHRSAVWVRAAPATHFPCHSAASLPLLFHSLVFFLRRTANQINRLRLANFSFGNWINLVSVGGSWVTLFMAAHNSTGPFILSGG